MTGSIVLIGKFAAAVMLGVAGILALRAPWIDRHDWRTFVTRLLLFAAVMRLLLFVVVYFVLGLPATSDLVPYYYEPSRRVLDGVAVWYDPDTKLFYGPFFPYLTAIPLLVSNSPVSIVALMIVVELAAIVCWLHAGRAISGDATARRAGIAYVFFPLTLLTTVLGGNNDVLVSLFIGASLWLFAVRSQLGSAALLALGFLTSKLHVGLAAPGLTLGASAPVKWAATFAAVLVGVYGALALSGADFLSPLLFHAGTDRSSGNLPFLLDALGANTVMGNRVLVTGVAALALLSVLAIPLWHGARRLPLQGQPPMLGAITLVAMLLSAKAYPHYLLTTLFAILLVWCGRAWRTIDVVVFLASGILVTVESSLWFRWLNNQRITVALSDPAVAAWRVAAFVVVEIALVLCYAWILRLCVRELRVVVREARAQSAIA